MMLYKDPSASVEARVEDLMSRMSFEQKIDQITCLVTITEKIPDFRDYVPNGIGNVGAFTVASDAMEIAEYSYRLQKFLVEETELGIPALIHCEAASGAQFTEANVFPSAIAQASTFMPSAIGDMASIIREQLYAVGFRQALSPVLDISRDARWGRITETYGEDPTLTSAMASAFVKNLQCPDNPRKGIAATPKHFIAHGITEGGLNMGRNLVGDREIEEVHAKPFQAAITEGGMMGVMCSYCQIDGEPVVCSKKLLTNLLREKMDFKGIVVSDYVAVDRIIDPFCVAENFEEAGILAMQAGLDVEYPRPKGFTYKLKEAVESGSISMETIDQAVRRVLTVKFTLGLFENPYPDKELLRNVLHTEKANKLNRKIAEKAVTLLKNNNNLLPLSDAVKKIAVIGPHAESVRSYFGTFSYPAAIDMTYSRDEDGQIFEEPGLIIYDIKQKYVGEIRENTPRVEKRIRKEFSNTRTLTDAIRERVPNAEVTYAKGINFSGNDIGAMREALNNASEADVIILTIGGKNGWGVTSTVGEGVDSTDIDLPGRQEEFAKAVYDLHKKTVVIHFDGRPLSNEFVASHFDAIIEAWQLGEFGGQALASVLFGDVNPAGRLPLTAARNAGQLPVYYGLPRGSGYVGAGHMGMIRNPNGYINDTAFPLYYFGHGLSYTNFEYESISLSAHELSPKENLEVSVTVKNSGKYDGEEVVQLYISDRTSSIVRPSIELCGFNRIFIPVGESKTVQFELDMSQFAFIGKDGLWRIEKGSFDIFAGSSSSDLRLQDSFYITETINIDAAKRSFYATVK